MNDPIEAILAIRCPARCPQGTEGHACIGFTAFHSERIRAAVSPKNQGEARPSDCVCPFPRTSCPSCDNPCRACRYARAELLTKSADPSTRTEAACEAWCGTPNVLSVGLPREIRYCTEACRDARKTLHPAAPEGGNR